MPGPGGGGHGGGGGRGGSFGGGGHGGGFGGGGRGGGFGGGHPPRPHRPPFMGGWGWRPRPYGGGGCLGGLLGMIFVPVVVILMIILLIVGSLGLSDNVVIDNYDEGVFQEFAYDRYMQVFSAESDKEDQILLVFVAYEDNYTFNYIALTGDHIDRKIDNMFGSDNATELGRLMNNSISEYYKYSLDSNLAQVIDSLTEKVTALELESSFTCKTEHAAVRAELINETDLPLTSSTVVDALKDFTEQTGISFVVLVADSEDVFGTAMPRNSIATKALLVVLIVVIVILVVALVRKKNKGSSDDTRRYND